MKKALLVYSSFASDDFVDVINIFSKIEEISSFLEFESFDGSELAFLEDGELLELIPNKGRYFKDIFQKEKFVQDFKYIDVIRTGDFAQAGKLKSIVNEFLARRGIRAEPDWSLEQIMDILIREIGVQQM